MSEIVFTTVLLLGLPVALLFFLRASAGAMSLASCAGLVILGTLDPVVVTTAGSIVPGEGEAYVRLSVVMLSLVFGALLFRNSVSSGQIPIHLLLVFLISTMLWLILPGDTGVSWLLDSTKQSLWQRLNDFRTLIVSVGFALSLVTVMLATHKKHKKSPKH